MDNQKKRVKWEYEKNESILGNLNKGEKKWEDIIIRKKNKII